MHEWTNKVNKQINNTWLGSQHKILSFGLRYIKIHRLVRHEQATYMFLWHDKHKQDMTKVYITPQEITHEQVWDTCSTLWKFMNEILEWNDKQLGDMDITS